MILGAGAALILSLTACTDDFDETNVDPNKMPDAKLELMFPGVVYNSMNTIQEINFRYVASLAQYNVHWFEQKDTEDYNKMLDMYKNSLNNLAVLERKYVGVEGCENSAAMLLTWKSYLYYYLVCCYGCVPMSEATTPEVKETYKYDTQEQVYKTILDLLDQATDAFDTNGDQISKVADPIFDGDISKWRDFANTLRLQVAVTIQNSDAALAEEHIRKALTGDNAAYLIKDDVKFQFGTDINNDGSWLYRTYIQQYDIGATTGYGTYGAMSHNFYLYMGSYNDPRFYKFVQRAEGTERARISNDTITRVNAEYPDQLRDSVIVERYRIPYQARPDYKEVPSGWSYAPDPNSDRGELLKGGFDNVQKATKECLVNYDFMKCDGIIPILSVAELNFMMAEVAVKYPGIVAGTAEQYYNDGIRASMASWGVSSSDVTAYLNTDGIKWNTDGEGLFEYRGLYKADIKGKNNPLEQIYKQWYIADFFNGFAGWTLERRTRAMKFPPHFYNESKLIAEGSNGICDFMMERLIYPINEHAANTEAWLEAIKELQRESPWWAKEEYKTANNGDNFYTLLRFAAPQPENIDDWYTGNVTVGGHLLNDGVKPLLYPHSEFIRHPYGRTYEEILKNVGETYNVTINDDADAQKKLTELIDWKLSSKPHSIYNKDNGRVLKLDRKGNIQFHEDGSFVYADEVEEEE